MTRIQATVDRGDVVVAGIGSPYRHDDGVGAVVCERAARLGGARDAGPVGDPLELLGRWDDAALAVVVDAVHSGGRPGAIQVVDLTGGPDGGTEQIAAPFQQAPPAPRSPGRGHPTSSHGVDLLGVLRLARAVGTAPAQVVLVGIEGEDFSPGMGFSPQVAAALPEAIAEVVRLVQEVRPCA